MITQYRLNDRVRDTDTGSNDVQIQNTFFFNGTAKKKKKKKKKRMFIDLFLLTCTFFGHTSIVGELTEKWTILMRFLIV